MQIELKETSFQSQNDINFITLFNKPHNINSLNDVSLTKREVDILTCLIHGKSNKSIASLLAMSHRTVGTHLRNLMGKFNSHSREGLIQHIEKSTQFTFFKKYYVHLLIQTSFEKCLQNIARIIHGKIFSCLIVYSSKMIERQRLNHLSSYLLLSGIRVSFLDNDTQSHEFSRQLEDSPPNFILCPLVDVPDESFKALLQKYRHQKTGLVIMLTSDSLNDADLESYGKVIQFSKNDTYYERLLKILTLMLSDVVPGFNQIIMDFKKSIHSLRDEKLDVLHHKGTTTLPVGIRQSFSFISLVTITGGIASIIALIIALLSHSSINVTSQKQNLSFLKDSIRSDFPIPEKQSYIERPDLLKTIDANFKAQTDGKIKTVALVGQGGAGKTTLARHYACSQKHNVVWELNAENKSSLIQSLLDLAYRLAISPQQKNDFENIQKTQVPLDKEKRLISFIKQNLKNVLSWFLIYDNVENIRDIHMLFPQDHQTWGTGQILITTRNQTLHNAAYINSTNRVFIQEFSEKDAIALTSNILHQKAPEQLTPDKRHGIEQFLKHIPLFPLDVTVAAFYINSTRISFDDYLEHLNVHANEFDKMQLSIIKDISEYPKTRYGIISSSFERLIQISSDYKDLLFLICFVDSQDISKKLLAFCKSSLIVDQFIFHLKNHGLITSELHKPQENLNTNYSFSIHRSTQTLGQQFLFHKFTKEHVEEMTALLTTTFNAYFNSYFDNNPQCLIYLMPHLRATLDKISIMSVSSLTKKKTEQDLYYLLAYSHLRGMRNLQLERTYFEKAHQLQYTTQYFTVDKYATLLRKLGEVCSNLHLMDETLRYTIASNELYKTLPNSETKMAYNYCTIAQAYIEQNNFEKAEINILEGIKQVENLSSEKGKEALSTLYTDLGWAYSMMYIKGEKSKEAIKYGHKALRIMDADHIFYQGKQPKTHKKISCTIARHKARLGESYARSGHYEESLHFGLNDAHYIIDHALDDCPHHLLKTYITSTIGEVYLRQGNITKAKETLQEAINRIERIEGTNSTTALIPLVHLIETRIRLNELEEAHHDYLSVIQIKNHSKANYAQLTALKSHYLAAVISCKQSEFKTSIKHMDVFLKEIRLFCKNFLTQDSYNALEAKNEFTIDINKIFDKKESIRQLFQQCTHIYTAIYGMNHPFVVDFVIKNETLS